MAPSPAAKHSLSRLLAGFPNAKVQTVAAFIKSQQAAITAVLNDFYVLLVLAIVVSLFGIVNTLVLSIVERTREIGALRAMGMTRHQLKRMIRIESQITALIGAVFGIVVGVTLAALATVALSAWSLTFTIPVSTLAGMIVIAFFAGRIASRFPARRPPTSTRCKRSNTNNSARRANRRPLLCYQRKPLKRADRHPLRAELGCLKGSGHRRFSLFAHARAPMAAWGCAMARALGLDSPTAHRIR